MFSFVLFYIRTATGARELQMKTIEEELLVVMRM
jgi:hypothetical protein